MRRNVESVNSRFGNLVAIVAGDYLLARSAAIAAGLGTEIAGLLADHARAAVPGSGGRGARRVPDRRTEEEYFTAIAGKTAALMATSCRIGALTGGAPTDEVDALTAFGRCFGMVFQLRDDVLDVVASDEELGKPPGQDLAEGIYTLPVLLALRGPRRRARAAHAARPAPRPARAGQGPRHRGRVARRWPPPSRWPDATPPKRPRRRRRRSPAVAAGLGRLAASLVDDLTD